MSTVEINRISKSFGAVKAVDRVSFSVEKGEIFGLLGPNGAGKTTTIRIILDLFKPDSGEVLVFDGPMTEAKKDRIGYMPEDRGLYQDIQLDRCLIYLGTLKNLSTAEARSRVGDYLERFDLAQHRQKKIKELSKGMQQKAQIIATLLHEPDLVVIDEPFTALDPVNTQMIKDILLDLQNRGITLVMSTHQMHQVEEMCDRIILIDHGRSVLYGDLAEIRKRFSGHAVHVRTMDELPDLAGIKSVQPHNAIHQLNLSPGTSPQEVLQALVDRGIVLEQFEIATPTLDEIFIRVVQANED